MAKQYENACRLSELMKATRQCAKNVRWKESVEAYEDKALLKNHTLAAEIKKETYKISPYIQFYVQEPKERLIHATRIRDRVWQRSMCNNGLYDDMTRGLIYDNAACQKGKGVDFAIDRMKEQMRRYYRQNHTNKGWAVHLDIHHYFPSTPQSVAKDTLRHRIRDPNLLRHAEAIVDSFEDTRTAEEIAESGYAGKCGIHLGSQMSQLIQLGNPDRIDHYLKEHMHVRYYARYMDDFIIIDSSRKHLMECINYVEASLWEMGLSLNEKSCVYRLEQGITYLHIHFKLTESGKVILRMDRKSISKERKKLRSLKALLGAGKISMDDVRAQYNSWTAHVKRTNSHGIRKQMSQYYSDLFGENPTVKL